MVPFLKWPGGKRWFICHHAGLFPATFDRYIEPFLGGGSVYFHLRPAQAVLADTNEELITTYRAIRHDWRRVVAALKAYERLHSKRQYYRVRASRPTSPVGRAARMLYLNRTCFNGIYRVNREGVFNVPKGTKSAVVLPTDDFEGAARLLRAAELRVSDFEPVLDEAGEGDLVFADPPYTVSHNNNGFVKYNENLFSWSDQQRLAEALDRARQRGAMIVATNAAHDAVKELYLGGGFTVRSVARTSTISAATESRKQFGEIIILANCPGEEP